MTWNKFEPHEGILAPDFNDVIRDNNTALETALNAWIKFQTGGTQTGQPRQGSARPYFQDAAPTTRLDGNHFDSSDLGCIWIDSNSSPDNQFNILTAADGAGNNTWTPISTEIIAVLVAAAHTWALTQTFAVQPAFTKGIIANNTALQGRNAADSANVDILKITTANLLQLLTVAILPDTSQLATSAAPNADPQIANKKYVDDKITAAKAAIAWTHSGSSVFGPSAAPASWTDLDLSSVVGSNYAFVILKVKLTGNATWIKFRTNGDTEDVGFGTSAAGGASTVELDNGHIGYVTLETDSGGIIEWERLAACTIQIWVVGYIPED